MIVRIWEVKRVACYARAETFTEAVASMVATPLQEQTLAFIPTINHSELGALYI